MSNQNDNFDFEEFAVRAIRNIDSIRSHAKEGTLPVESRINAFYRAVGLPAVVPENEKELPKGRPDPYNNGNVGDLNFNTYNVRLDERQELYNKKIEDSEVEEFLDINKQNIKASISTSSGNRSNRRKRGVLFPMIVDGRLHVFPQYKRVGAAFMSQDELKHGKVQYKRPLIETILSVKLKGENIVDSTKQEDVNTAFESSGLQDLHKDAEARLSQTLNKVVFVLEDTVKLINRARRSVGFNVVPKVENIPEENQKIQESETRTGELEVMKSEQDIQTGTLNTILSIFEFDDTAGSAGSTTRNLRGDSLTGLFLEMLVPSKQAKRHSSRIDRQITKAKNDIKRAFRSLDLLLGTFSSISGVDVLVVISALYRLDSEYLVGLLNKESQDRLKAIRGNIPAISGAKGLLESITKLETEITKIFDELDGSISIIKHDEKVRHQDSGERT